MNITGTHFNYYFICHRKLWLFANNIQMEHTSDLVASGRQLHETSYDWRPDRYQELELDGIKLDYYDRFNKIIHEVKHSAAMEQAHLWQVKYYLYVLEKHGIVGAKGLLEYPKIRQTKEVLLSDIDREKITEICEDVEKIVAGTVPVAHKTKVCNKCSYYEFCFITEEET